MTLDEARANLGAAVAYDPGHGHVETGVITSVSETWVHVQYAEGALSKATPSDLLNLLDPPVPPGFVEVVTRYGGHKHLARHDRFVRRDSRHYTRCHAVSAFTIESWQANPDHPLLSSEQIRALPRCSECWKTAP